MKRTEKNCKSLSIHVNRPPSRSYWMTSLLRPHAKPLIGATMPRDFRMEVVVQSVSNGKVLVTSTVRLPAGTKDLKRLLKDRSWIMAASLSSSKALLRTWRWGTNTHLTIQEASSVDYSPSGCTMILSRYSVALAPKRPHTSSASTKRLKRI